MWNLWKRKLTWIYITMESLYAMFLLGCFHLPLTISYQKGTWGTHFMFAVPVCNNKSLTSIFVIPQDPRRVSLLLYTRNYTNYIMRNGESIRIPISCSEPTWNSIGLYNGGKLTSSRRIMVYIELEYDTTLLHPVDALGLTYKVLVLNSSDVKSVSKTLTFHSTWFIFHSIYDKTIIKINASLVPNFTDIFKHKLFRIDNNFQVILDKNECFYVKMKVDLSGILIKSDKPITVIAGSILQKANGIEVFTIEHMLENQNWGRQFVIPGIPRLANMIKVTGREYSKLNIRTEEMNSALSFGDGGCLSLILNTNGYIIIDADSPVFVLLIFSSSESLKKEFINSITATPTALAIQRFTFSLQARVTFHASFAVVGPDDSLIAFNNLDLYLNESVKVISYQQINRTINFQVFHNLKFSKSFKLYAKASQSIIPCLTGFVYSSANISNRVYGMGMYLSKIHDACSRSISRISDGKDNDCDGYTDEELANGLDDDDDDLIDEDNGILFWPLLTRAKIKRMIKSSGISAYVISVIISIVIALLSVIGFIAFMVITDRLNIAQNLNPPNRVLPLVE